MTCKRCEDIHTAQRDGKTQDECKCTCHNTTTSTFTYNTGDTVLCDCTTATTTDGLMDWNASGGASSFSLNCDVHKQHDSGCQIQRINIGDNKCRCK